MPRPSSAARGQGCWSADARVPGMAWLPSRTEYRGPSGEYHLCVAWDRLADQVSLGFSFTKSTNHTSRAVIAPAAIVGHPPHGTVHAQNIP
jgi:hypothetical protein